MLGKCSLPVTYIPALIFKKHGMNHFQKLTVLSHAPVAWLYIRELFKQLSVRIRQEDGVKHTHLF
jgi:hypothetical protein